MLSVDEARDRILGALRPVGAETLALSEAWGRVLAVPVRARLTQPPADVSAMDGYAVRAADAVAGARLKVIGTAPAGHPFDGPVGPGESVRIFTGAFLPAGADGVLLQENAEAAAGFVTVNETVQPGRWIRRAGLDFTDGEVLLPAGRKLTARDIGLAAAANHPWLTVYRAPRIGILATGDEISLPGETLSPGGIVSSNAHALAALVRAAGGVPIVLPIARDDVSAIAEAARMAKGCDLLVTTGGASVGEHDLVQQALGPEGFALDFWKIAMRPGKPLIWGRLGETPLLGLPGNPVSSLVCGIVFLWPAIIALGGRPGLLPPLLRASLGADLPANDRRADYLRATLAPGVDGHWVATAFGAQDSSMMKTMARADALLLRAPHAEALAAGSAIDIIVLSELGL
jgi:molybdopterin molybdotransferase